jgi:hypothetical protein
MIRAAPFSAAPEAFESLFERPEFGRNGTTPYGTKIKSGLPAAKHGAKSKSRVSATRALL